MKRRSNQDNEEVVGRRAPAPAETTAGMGMPALQQRKHLRRLDLIFERHRSPIFYLTNCVENRQPILANEMITTILVEAWRNSCDLYGWSIGRYIIMPDHVHFFASPGNREGSDLSSFMSKWKRWTQRQIRKSSANSFAWQKEFFDHLLRSDESYARKWEYVRQNPVKKELVSQPEDWPYQGEIVLLEW